MPTEDLTSDLKSDTDSASVRQRHHQELNRVASFKSSTHQAPGNRLSNEALDHSNHRLSGQSSAFNEDEEIKTPDFDMDYRFAAVSSSFKRP